jgi:peptidoglycan/LPS O-acetylase OafA/YrhL
MVTLESPEGRCLPLVRLLQFLGVVTVCINHLTISLLKTPTPTLPSWMTSDLPVAGITLLFVSTGFCVHLGTKQRSLFTTAGRVEATGLVLTALALMLPIVWLCLAADVLVSGYTFVAKSAGVLSALPFSAFLTQNWIFKTIGDATLVAPFASSNVVWIGGSLLFVVAAYALSSRFVTRLGRPATIFACALVIYAANIIIHSALFSNIAAINAYAVGALGEMAGGHPAPAAFAYFSWLQFYAPWIRLPEFFIGVLLAHYYESSSVKKAGGGKIGVATGLLLGGFCIYFACLDHPWSPAGKVAAAGLGSVGLILLAAECSHHRYGMILGNHPLVASLSASAFVLWCWHLFWYNAYTIPPIETANPWHIGLVVARILALNLFVVLTAVGLTHKIQIPIARWFRSRVLALKS